MQNFDSIATDEQKDVIDFAVHGADNMIINAIAGSGKTKVLVECVRAIKEAYPKKKILMVAHNKSAADKLRGEIYKTIMGLDDDYVLPNDDDSRKARTKYLWKEKNIRISTLHALGFRLLYSKFGKIEEKKQVDNTDEKYYREFIGNQNTYSEAYSFLSEGDKATYRSNLKDTLKKARLNLKEKEKDIRRLMEKHYVVSLIADEAHAAQELIKWGASTILPSAEDTAKGLNFSENGRIDYTDMLWLPFKLGINVERKEEYDVILLDEAQDASPAQMDVLKRIFSRSARLIAVGDEQQQINVWAGSDTEVFEHLRDSLVFRRRAKDFNLSTNFRCDKKILEEGGRYFKEKGDLKLNPRKDAGEGEVLEDVHVSLSHDYFHGGDLVMCRQTSPLVYLYKKMVQNNIKCFIEGKDDGRKLNDVIEDAKCGNNFDDIKIAVKKRLVDLYDEHKEKNPNTESVPENITALMDNVLSLECFPDTIKTRKQAEEFIKGMFMDTIEEGNSRIEDRVRLSTIHKMKGQEADNVYILCPNLIPSNLAKSKWQRTEETHLQYVMCTRAKHKLAYISESDFPSFTAFLNKEKFSKKIELYREEVATHERKK